MNNESAEITRMLCQGFDSVLPPEKREANKGLTALVPKHLQDQIEEMNSWVYDTVNNGVYKVGFATSQAVYNEHVTRLFQSLDRLEKHLSLHEHHPYLFGQFITEADIRLFTTLVRFDIAYYTLFKCNIKMIRLDYPRLHAWLRRLYWNEGLETAGGAFKSTTHFDVVSFLTVLTRLQLIRTDQARIRFCNSRQRRCSCGSPALYIAALKMKIAHCLEWWLV